MNSYKRNQKICLKEFDRDKYKDVRVRLTKEFQCKIFSELIEKFSSIELAIMLNISRPMIYHYRNYRVNNVSLEMLKLLNYQI